MNATRLDDQMNTVLAVAFVALSALAAIDVGHEHMFGRSDEIKLSAAAAQSLNPRRLEHDAPAQAVAMNKRIVLVAAR